MLEHIYKPAGYKRFYESTVLWQNMKEPMTKKLKRTLTAAVLCTAVATAVMVKGCMEPNFGIKTHTIFSHKFSH